MKSSTNSREKLSISQLIRLLNIYKQDNTIGLSLPISGPTYHDKVKTFSILYLVGRDYIFPDLKVRLLIVATAKGNVLSSFLFLT